MCQTRHTTPSQPSGASVAVIGSGISGLSTAWLLHESGFKVTLYESEQTAGGHTLTDHTSSPPVDLGFQVFNLSTYGNLFGFLNALGVASEPSDMSFSVSVDQGSVEWASHSADSVFAQKRNLASPRFLRMVWDVLRFGRNAAEVLEGDEWETVTLEEYLNNNGYSHVFATWYLLPMAAAVWSGPTNNILKFPVRTFVRFWKNHHFLEALGDRPKWRVVKNRSEQYVKKVLEELPDVRLGTAVTAVSRTAPGVRVQDAGGGDSSYDHVVMATHTDVSLKLLKAGEGGATVGQEEILGSILYESNDIYLHADDTLMPKDKKCWAAWNCLERSDDSPSMNEISTRPVCCTYWLNLLQNLPEDSPPRFCTLNPQPAPSKVIRRLSLSHPQFTTQAVAAQGRLGEIQGQHGIWFCGAWCGFGFHEDGIKSGVKVAEMMGAHIPWDPITSQPNTSMWKSLCFRLFDNLARSCVKEGVLRVIMPDGAEHFYGQVGPQPGGGPGPSPVVMRVISMDFFPRLVCKDEIGLNEGYMYKEYDCEDITTVLQLFAVNAPHFAAQYKRILGPLNWFGGAFTKLAHALRPNTVAGSRKNISDHYDLGNDMFELFLDESMTYSSGIYKTPTDSLHQAQMNKLDAIITKAQITASDHVVEIGCGWGSMAIRAATTTGCRVTGITISTEQLEIARRRVKEAGVGERVNLIFCDYRKMQGQFDKLVSIEMLEAVGKEFLEDYFEHVERLLKPNGIAVIQVITMKDERYREYCEGSDFIRAHIFPGCHLPSVGHLKRLVSQTRLQWDGTEDIGLSYATTLCAWKDTFVKEKDTILQLGYSETFWRKWVTYFAYCEVGFATQMIEDQQVVLTKKDTAALVSRSSSSKDSVTHLLVVLWVFMFGVMVGQQPVMARVPIVCCACFAGHSATGWCTPAGMPLRHRHGWSTSMVHLCFSLYIASQLPLLSPPNSWSWPQPVLRDLILSSTGFFAWDLWRSVSQDKEQGGGTLAVAIRALSLICFTTASFKGWWSPLLGVVMGSEVSSCLLFTKRLLRYLGFNMSSPIYVIVSALSLLLFLCYRVLLHASVLHTLVTEQTTTATFLESQSIAIGTMALVSLYNLRWLLQLATGCIKEYQCAWNSTAYDSEAQQKVKMIGAPDVSEITGKKMQ